METHFSRVSSVGVSGMPGFLATQRTPSLLFLLLEAVGVQWLCVCLTCRRKPSCAL